MDDLCATAVMFDPHPDDADWWTGGLTLLLKARGWDVHYLCVGPTTDRTRSESLEAAEVAGVTRHFLEIPIKENSKFRWQLRDAVPPLIQSLNPTLVFIPSPTDYHVEHVDLARELLRLFHWSQGVGLGALEVYSYDSHENRDPIEIFIDISDVWDQHVEALQCHRNFERPSLPENTLIRVKRGRSMQLGAAQPAESVLHAEGYRLLQGDVKCLSTLPRILGDGFAYRSPCGLLNL
jgi:LmbE family N-acetylglucosaminyl deacetylase